MFQETLHWNRRWASLASMRWPWLVPVLVLVACAHQHQLVATLDRSPCNGTCPTYSVYIYDDGDVEYIGSQYVKVTGSATTRLGHRQLAALHELFARASYFTLRGSYEATRTNDVPLISTSYTHGGRTKEIQHPASPDIPLALAPLEDGIDALVHIERWIGTRGERERHHSYER